MYILVKIASILSALLLFFSGLLGGGAPAEKKDVKADPIVAEIAENSELIVLENGLEIVVTRTLNNAPTVEERKIMSRELVTVKAKDNSFEISGRFTGFAGANENRILLYTATALGEKVEAYDYSGNKVFELCGVSKINSFCGGAAVVNEFDVENFIGKSYYVNQFGEKISDDFSVCSDLNECGYAVVYLQDGSCGVIAADGSFVLSPAYDYVTLDGNMAVVEVGGNTSEIILN